MKIDTVYEDKNIIAINKPAGILVHSTTPAKSSKMIARSSEAGFRERAGIEETVVGWLLSRFPEVIKIGDSESRPGIVHRLDKDTSGIMVIAKNQKTFDHLKTQFQKREITKTYRAIVYGKLKESKGVIDKPISLKPGTTKRTVHGGKMTKTAITEYKVLEEFEDASYIEVDMKTGRTHQIRVHLASIGHPVLGDKLYGSKTSKQVKIPSIEHQLLHAYTIEIEPIEGKKIGLTADIPEQFEAVLQYLRDTVHS